MQKRTFSKLLFIAAVTSANWLLSGCGGGGSGVATPTLSTDLVPFTSAVKYEVLTSTGAVLYAYLRSDFTSTPLSGLVVGSPPEFAHAFNALFSNGSLLTGTSMWGAAAAYLKLAATNVASVPRPRNTSNLYRNYYEVGGNVLTGDLLKLAVQT